MHNTYHMKLHIIVYELVLQLHSVHQCHKSLWLAGQQRVVSHLAAVTRFSAREATVTAAQARPSSTLPHVSVLELGTSSSGDGHWREPGSVAE